MFKKILKSSWLKAVGALALVGCAGTMRSCHGCMAEEMGADWIVVQYKTDGIPMNCWRLPGTSVANEQGSDGIHWYETSGHLVHISGWYNRVQVSHGDWAGAARTIGVDLESCGDGKYSPTEKK